MQTHAPNCLPLRYEDLTNPKTYRELAKFLETSSFSFQSHVDKGEGRRQQKRSDGPAHPASALSFFGRKLQPPLARCGRPTDTQTLLPVALLCYTLFSVRLKSCGFPPCFVEGRSVSCRRADDSAGAFLPSGPKQSCVFPLALDLVRRSTVIDMLGLLTLNYSKLSSWEAQPACFAPHDFQRLRASGITIFHPAVGFTDGDVYASSLRDITGWNEFIAVAPERVCAYRLPGGSGTRQSQRPARASSSASKTRGIFGPSRTWIASTASASAFPSSPTMTT